jgi:hypothetical protein
MEIEYTAKASLSNLATVRLISLAAKSSFAVYKNPFDFGVKDFEYEDVGEIPASRDGSIKATLIRLQPDHRTLVIAFKGSKTLIDWIVNANTDLVDASEVSGVQHTYALTNHLVPPWSGNSKSTCWIPLCRPTYGRKGPQ